MPSSISTNTATNTDSPVQAGGFGPLVIDWFDPQKKPKNRHPIFSLLHALLSFDCFPDFSARVRRAVYNPLGILILAAMAALLCGLALHTQGLVLFAALCAVMVLGLVWPWLNLRGLSGSLTFDLDRIEEGSKAVARLELVNRLPWTAWGLAVRGDWNRHNAENQVGIASAPGLRTLSCQWTVQPEKRGIYPGKSLSLTTGFPFGLWESRKQLATGSRLIVWPKTFPVGPVPPVGGERLIEGHVSHAKVGSNGDVLGVRPYRRGDSPRRIHWAQSARHDRLIVCELQSNSRPVIQIVLDANPGIHAGDAWSGTWEWAIRIAASLARGWIESGAQVALAWGGGDIGPASGQAQIRKVLDQLAAMPCASTEPIEKVLACPHCRGFRDGLQVIITTDLACHDRGCHGCATESQRWVVLDSAGFSNASTPNPSPVDHEGIWLNVPSPGEVPALLKGGWREARHGS